MDFAKLLTDWYLQNRRDLPWRDTVDPYKIWLAEIILQQTRVAQGLPYFLKFADCFPTVHNLANADEQSILKIWQGLGYYSRARNLHKTAKYVSFELAGKFPDNYDELVKLPGIGSYTAAAIASFSYNEPKAVVDGNVFRVLSRYFNIDTDIANSSAKKEFTALATRLMPNDEPALFNQSIMEFGALQCVPKNPDCTICPMMNNCLAFRYGKVHLLPVKAKKAKPRDRYFNYMVFADDNQNTVIQKRTAKDIWQNLYEFPLLETLIESDADSIAPLVTSDSEILYVSEMTPRRVVHKLSHQNLHIRFWKVTVKGNLQNGMAFEQVRHYPLPVVLHNFVEAALE